MAPLFGASAHGGRRAQLAGFLSTILLLIVIRLVVETRRADDRSWGSLSHDDDERAERFFQRRRDEGLASEEEGGGYRAKGTVSGSGSGGLGSPNLASPPVKDEERPRGPRSKVAFLFLTARTIPQHPIWTKFFEGADERLFSLYVNANPGAEPQRGIFAGKEVKDPVTTQWGKFSIVRATIHLLKTALEDEENQRFALLSDNSIPLYNFHAVYCTLMVGGGDFFFFT